MSFRRGVRLGVDVGSVRVGVARCDPDGILAVPVATIARDSAGHTDIAQLADFVREYDAIEVIVGLPITLSGDWGVAAETAHDFARTLAAVLAVPVRLVDERLTTVSAQRNLHANGKDTRTTRSVIDQAAAVLIVQTAVDTEKSSGSPPGRVVAHE